MSSIRVKPLGEGLSFGSRVEGVTLQTVQDEAVRRQLNDLFQDRGLIVFEGVETDRTSISWSSEQLRRCCMANRVVVIVIIILNGILGCCDFL